MEKAMAPVEMANKLATQAATFGHLAPEKDKTYPGYVLFGLTAWGDEMLINGNFRGLDDSPWLYSAMQELVGKYARKSGAIYLFKGTFRNFVFEGTVEKQKLKR
jgi:hypothetical protein